MFKDIFSSKSKSKIELLRDSILEHNLYDKLNNIESLRVFTELHVFSVWDFMTLLKFLQKNLTSTKTPWLPSSNKEQVRFINELVLLEESDFDIESNVASHFEIYKQAMKEIGASTEEIDTLISSLNSGFSLTTAIQNPKLSKPARRYLERTFAVVNEGCVHKVAAAFTFGRETLVPDIFRILIKDVGQSHNAPSLIHYFERHIRIEDDQHKFRALKLVDDLCKGDVKKIKEVQEVTKDCLKSRIQLWDAIDYRLQNKTVKPSKN